MAWHLDCGSLNQIFERFLLVPFGSLLQPGILSAKTNSSFVWNHQSYLLGENYPNFVNCKFRMWLGIISKKWKNLTAFSFVLSYEFVCVYVLHVRVWTRNLFSTCPNCQGKENLTHSHKHTNTHTRGLPALNPCKRGSWLNEWLVGWLTGRVVWRQERNKCFEWPTANNEQQRPLPGWPCLQYLKADLYVIVGRSMPVCMCLILRLYV